ncbi:hypothetical protein [Bacillus safensis]|uniref:hypothetical protein n=1 Tax=Bacillus safensis TaxID=561879 RepID=UPI0021C676DF|nr:hypothetical protein [Bacillus safensis]MCU0155711.1 hypothetical protein [Bacillus safensis]
MKIQNVELWMVSDYQEGIVGIFDNEIEAVKVYEKTKKLIKNGFRNGILSFYFAKTSRWQMERSAIQLGRIIQDRHACKRILYCQSHIRYASDQDDNL